ncbi:MAG: CPBP family intramembrane glutamic endopeptidase [Candidatus Micrarchaeia archaeon]
MKGQMSTKRKATKAGPRRASISKSARSKKYVAYASYIITLILVFLFIFSQVNFADMGCTAYNINSFSSMPLHCRLSAANNTIYLSLLFPSIVFSYLLFKGKQISSIISELGLSRKAFTARNILIGISLFFAIILLSIAMGLFSEVTSIPLPTNVTALLGGMPLYLLVFSFLIAPIDEEILFRGFLVPRIGIIASALLFALLHFSYSSISEVVAALVFGLLAGYVFKRTKSLYASITGHILVNMLTIIAMLLAGI